MPLSWQSVGIYQETSVHAPRLGTLGHSQSPSISRARQLASAARGVLQHMLPASCWPATILFRFRPYLGSLFLLVYARLQHVPGIILHRYNLAEESDFLNELHTVLY